MSKVTSREPRIADYVEDVVVTERGSHDCFKVSKRATVLKMDLNDLMQRIGSLYGCVELREVIHLTEKYIAPAQELLGELHNVSSLKLAKELDLMVAYLKQLQLVLNSMKELMELPSQTGSTTNFNSNSMETAKSPALSILTTTTTKLSTAPSSSTTSKK